MEEEEEEEKEEEEGDDDEEEEKEDTAPKKKEAVLRRPSSLEPVTKKARAVQENILKKPGATKIVPAGGARKKPAKA